jgi:hypothetical protein
VLAILPAAQCVLLDRIVRVPLCYQSFATMATHLLPGALRAILVPLDTNAAPKMRTFLQFLVPRADFLFQRQQIVPFVQLGMPAKLPATLVRFVLPVLLHWLVTDFAQYAPLDISAVIRQKVPLSALMATIKIRWDQRIALFVLLVTFAKTALNFP